MKIYRCERGHEIAIKGVGTWVSFQVATVDRAGKQTEHDYNHCPHCVGEDMLAKFPLTCTEVADPPADAA